MTLVEAGRFMTWFLSSRGTKHLHHLLKLVGFMGAQHLWKLGHICLVCSADGEEATEIQFLQENVVGFFGFFFWELSVDWCVISPSGDIPTRSRTRGMGRVYFVLFRVANDLSCPLESWQLSMWQDVPHSSWASRKQGLSWQDPPFTPASLPPSREVGFAFGVLIIPCCSPWSFRTT